MGRLNDVLEILCKKIVLKGTALAQLNFIKNKQNMSYPGYQTQLF
jgi:hypothetical protein